MSLASDLKSIINDFFAGLCKDGSKSLLTAINNSLTSTFASSTKQDDNYSWSNVFLTTHPVDFTGSLSENKDAVTVWSTIETLCNNVIVPIGGFILVIILLYELISMVMRGNNFKDFDDSIFIRWILKAVCGVILISNVFYISTGIFSFGTDVCAGGLTSIFGTKGSSKLTKVASKTFYDNMPSGAGDCFIIMMLLLLIYICVLVVTVAIIITMASRIIEVFMYLGIAPIPMATMMNDEWGQIGKNWIRGLLALSFQGFFIIVALGIFKTMYGNVITTINTVGKDTQIVPNLILLVGFSFALVFTILRSGSISKSIFNAS